MPGINGIEGLTTAAICVYYSTNKRGRQRIRNKCTYHQEYVGVPEPVV